MKDHRLVANQSFFLAVGYCDQFLCDCVTNDLGFRATVLFVLGMVGVELAWMLVGLAKATHVQKQTTYVPLPPQPMTRNKLNSLFSFGHTRKGGGTFRRDRSPILSMPPSPHYTHGTYFSSFVYLFHIDILVES